jgi:hypothetical protein
MIYEYETAPNKGQLTAPFSDIKLPASSIRKWDEF